MHSKASIIELTPKNIAQYGALCGHEGVSPKKRSLYEKGIENRNAWYRERYEEGLRIAFCLNESNQKTGIVEYVPGEHSWRTVNAKGYIVIHCLYIFSRWTKKGYGSLLLNHVHAKSEKYDGMSIVTSSKPWVNEKSFFLKRGFRKIAYAPPYFELLVLPFRKAALPTFRPGWDNRAREYGKGITVLYSDQCPAAEFGVSNIASASQELGMSLRMVKIDGYTAAQDAPSPYGTFNVVLDGEFLTHRIYDKQKYIALLKNEIP